MNRSWRNRRGLAMAGLALGVFAMTGCGKKDDDKAATDQSQLQQQQQAVQMEERGGAQPQAGQAATPGQP